MDSELKILLETLKKRIEELVHRIEELERRPVYVPVYPYIPFPQPNPPCPTTPYYSPWGTGPTTCGTAPCGPAGNASVLTGAHA